MRTQTVAHDKISWGDGPWVGEPDKAQWTHETTGSPCLAVRDSAGAWCGYVGVRSDHPLYGTGWDAITDTVFVHGGLNYSSRTQDGEMTLQDLRVCSIPDDDVWWFGFDCAHVGDYSPIGQAVIVTTENYRTLPYVRAQCTRLALQLADCRVS